MYIVRAKKSAAAGAVTIEGNGIMAHRDGAIMGADLGFSSPIVITDPDGNNGAPYFRMVPPNHLGPFIGTENIDDPQQKLSGQLMGDQPIRMMPYRDYFIQHIDVDYANASGTGMTGALFTGPDRTGVALLPPGTDFGNLGPDRWTGGIAFEVDPGVRSGAPYLYFSLDTPSTAPLTFELTIRGFVRKQA